MPWSTGAQDFVPYAALAANNERGYDGMEFDFELERVGGDAAKTQSKDAAYSPGSENYH